MTTIYPSFTVFVNTSTPVNTPVYYTQNNVGETTFLVNQVTNSLYSSTNKNISVGYGTVNALKTTMVSQEQDYIGQWRIYFNFVGNGSIPGLLAVNLPSVNQIVKSTVNPNTNPGLIPFDSEGNPIVYKCYAIPNESTGFYATTSGYVNQIYLKDVGFVQYDFYLTSSAQI